MPISRDTRDFFRIVTVATALGFGAATASLYSLRHGEDGFDFEFNLGTVVAFVAGAALAWGYWRMILKRSNRTVGPNSPVRADESRERRPFVIYSVILGLFGLGCLLYPLRYVTRENLSPVIQGIAMALLVVAAIGGALWGIARCITRLDKRTSETEASNADEDDAH